MAEQEKTSDGAAQVGSVIMVEKTTGSRHNKPCQPRDDTDVHHKRSKAPVVPFGEELKQVAENSTESERNEIEQRHECSHVISSEKQKHSVTRKLSSSTKKREPSPESIALATLQVDKNVKKPIPSGVQSDPVAKEKGAAKKTYKDEDNDSITDEITEMQTPEVAKEHSEWSDDEEAGGLPRSDSRASRVSRVAQKLFCCGVAYDAPSEDEISMHRSYPI